MQASPRAAIRGPSTRWICISQELDTRLSQGIAAWGLSYGPRFMISMGKNLCLPVQLPIHESTHWRGIRQSMALHLAPIYFSCSRCFLLAFNSACRAERLAFLILFFSSPFGQRWQCKHSFPKSHPWDFQKKPHGLHVPEA